LAGGVGLLYLPFKPADFHSKKRWAHPLHSFLIWGGVTQVAEQKENAEAPAEGGDAAEAVQKKGGDAPPAAAPSKLPLILTLVNTLLMVGIGVVVWMGYKKSGQKVTLDEVAAPAHSGFEAGQSEKKEDDKKDGKAALDLFVKESFTVTLADPGGSRFAQVDVEIEVPDDFVKQEVISIRPKIRDFVIVVLSSKTYDQIESTDGRDFLREEIRNKIDGELKRGKIKNIFFTQFIVQ
jgi:flagellar FliL protein